MAMSQQARKMAAARGGSSIFPWASASEWQQVYHDLFSGDAARMRRSCAHILSWTARSTSAMAFPIESTSDIVECLLLQETLAAQSLCSDHVLRLAYAMAVNRYLAKLRHIAIRSPTESTYHFFIFLQYQH